MAEKCELTLDTCKDPTCFLHGSLDTNDPHDYEGTCHCGGTIHIYEDGFTRGMCLACSTVRCDIDWPCPVVQENKYEETLDEAERTGH